MFNKLTATWLALLAVSGAPWCRAKRPRRPAGQTASPKEGAGPTAGIAQVDRRRRQAGQAA